MSKKSKITIVVATPIILIVILGLAVAVPRTYDIRTLINAAPIGTGYAAKMLCSAVFVSGREPERVWDEDLKLMRDNLVRGRVDRDGKFTEAWIPGHLFKRRAYYRENCGCTINLDTPRDTFMAQCDVDVPKLPDSTQNLPWPMGDADADRNLPANIDYNKINKALDWAFSEPDPELPVRTRAVIVLYDGLIVEERYGDGYSKDTRFLGWSMTKSVTNALIGILVKKGKLDIYKPAPIPEWKTPGDPRSEITTDQLLRMSSGLEFREEYEQNPDSDAGYMFFTKKDMAKFAAGKLLVNKPDEKFSYSSGTTMILSRIIRETVGGDYGNYLSFPRRELFNKIGIRSALIEPDPSGTMVGAGFGYMTARDWARFGILYYNDGIWNGERILPEGWVEYTRTPSSTYSGYGAQFWLNSKGKDRWLPNCPTDIYSAWGHEGQFITIVPSRKVIVVRLGQTPDTDKAWDHDFFISSILSAFPEDN